MFNVVWYTLAVISFGCNRGDVVGVYEADVPFRGKDPRFAGQHFRWRLHLSEDSIFSCTFELPMAVRLNDGRELVDKMPGVVEGQWVLKDDRLLLTRKSGEGALGSSNTISFSFHEGRLEIAVEGGTLLLQEGENHLEMRRPGKRLQEKSRPNTHSPGES